jgi:U3 small nucleolar RNA-associated protein 10
MFIPTKRFIILFKMYVMGLILQSQLGELMEHVVFLLHLVDARKKELNFSVIVRKELKETMRAVVRNITMVMSPSIYFKSIINLLDHSDKDVGEKV